MFTTGDDLTDAKVWCEVSVSDYPMVETLHAGQWVWIEGRISKTTRSYTDLIVITLDKLELQLCCIKLGR
jgi:hypothetical protein